MLRAPSLNLDPAFTASLADIVAAHLRGQAPYNLPTTRQYPLRCPGCVNQDCADSKEYFVTQSPAAVTQSVTGCALPSHPSHPPACCRGSEEFFGVRRSALEVEAAVDAPRRRQRAAA